ncbi:VOC family protein [Crocinitomix algicola]|uniref:VOC family protein n=1 Tax=Crocinitomix algicola TaxID=1740263 RepID=UPI0008339537|nr:VOC family protein [Crocinitomix algicola]
MNTIKINYIEFKAKDLKRVKDFYGNVFGWEFKDYGDQYIAFSNSGIEGGFEKTNQPIVNGALVVLYHDNLEEILPIIEKNGGKITVPIFTFPGGRRFQFEDLEGNELAVWTEIIE